VDQLPVRGCAPTPTARVVTTMPSSGRAMGRSSCLGHSPLSTSVPGDPSAQLPSASPGLADLRTRSWPEGHHHRPEDWQGEVRRPPAHLAGAGQAIDLRAGAVRIEGALGAPEAFAASLFLCCLMSARRRSPAAVLSRNQAAVLKGRDGLPVVVGSLVGRDRPRTQRRWAPAAGRAGAVPIVMPGRRGCSSR
jgi:hypothetical protein